MREALARAGCFLESAGRRGTARSVTLLRKHLQQGLLPPLERVAVAVQAQPLEGGGARGRAAVWPPCRMAGKMQRFRQRRCRAVTAECFIMGIYSTVGFIRIMIRACALFSQLGLPCSSCHTVGALSVERNLFSPFYYNNYGNSLMSAQSEKSSLVEVLDARKLPEMENQIAACISPSRHRLAVATTKRINVFGTAGFETGCQWKTLHFADPVFGDERSITALEFMEVGTLTILLVAWYSNTADEKWCGLQIHQLDDVASGIDVFRLRTSSALTKIASLCPFSSGVVTFSLTFVEKTTADAIYCIQIHPSAEASTSKGGGGGGGGGDGGDGGDGGIVEGRASLLCKVQLEEGQQVSDSACSLVDGDDGEEAFAVGLLNGTVHVYGRATSAAADPFQLRNTLRHNEDYAVSCLCAVSRTVLACAIGKSMYSTTVTLWQVDQKNKTEQRLRTLSLCQSVSSMCVLKDMLVAAHRDSTSLWRMSTGDFVRMLMLNHGESHLKAESGAYALSDDRLATVGEDGICLWTVPAPSVLSGAVDALLILFRTWSDDTSRQFSLALRPHKKDLSSESKKVLSYIETIFDTARTNVLSGQLDIIKEVRTVITDLDYMRPDAAESSQFAQFCQKHANLQHIRERLCAQSLILSMVALEQLKAPNVSLHDKALCRAICDVSHFLRNLYLCKQIKHARGKTKTKTKTGGRTRRRPRQSRRAGTRRRSRHATRRTGRKSRVGNSVFFPVGIPEILNMKMRL